MFSITSFESCLMLHFRWSYRCHSLERRCQIASDGPQATHHESWELSIEGELIIILDAAYCSCPFCQYQSPVKRQRIDLPMKMVPLRTELGGYSQQQLVDVIDRLVTIHPCLEQVSLSFLIHLHRFSCLSLFSGSTCWAQNTRLEAAWEEALCPTQNNLRFISQHQMEL
jgi:hypothetical protein